MELTDMKLLELDRKGYSNLGIHTFPSDKVDNIISSKKYKEVLLKNLNGITNICYVFVK